MSNKRKSLIDVVIRLGCLLKRPDLTDYERQKCQVQFLDLTGKFLTASDFSNEPELKIALDSVLKALQQRSSSQISSSTVKGD